MPFEYDVERIKFLLDVDLFYRLQPIILSNPFNGPEDALTSQPVLLLNHISYVLRLMKQECSLFVDDHYHPAYTVRIQRIADNEYFAPSEVDSRPSRGSDDVSLTHLSAPKRSARAKKDDTILNHEVTFSWDGYDFFVKISANGEMDFTHNRAFDAQCEFSGGFYDNADWDHEDYPLGLFTRVWERFDGHQQNVEHEPSGVSFNEKLMDTIWYIFYRMYRAGFVNAMKGFDVLPEDDEEEFEEQEDDNADVVDEDPLPVD